MTEPITVLIADDHGVVREGLRSMLEREGLQVIGEASTGRETIQMVKLSAPDVVLLQYCLNDFRTSEYPAGWYRSIPA